MSDTALAPDVTREDFTFTSADGTTSIHAEFWLPENSFAHNPRGIVQIAHGMEEYIGRYDAFARHLAANGYAVCGNDHIGHGQSVETPQRLSYLPENGAAIMIADLESLRAQFASRFPAHTPYVLFGHSMGSFVARCYLARYGRNLAGAIVCGTGQVPVALSRAGGWLARRIAARKGVDAHSALINGMADGGYAKKIKDARTPLDWLNSDPAKVDEYIADPLCGVQFNVGGYASLMDLTAEACSASCAAAVPDGLPVLFVAGGQDPVGDCGAGVRKAAASMEQHSAARVQCRIYEGMRHEILNEPDHAQVFADVLAWLDEVVGEADGQQADGQQADGQQADGQQADGQQ